MTSSFFFLQAEKTHRNQVFIDQLAAAATERKEQAYVISKPLGDARYTYSHEDAIVVLSPKRKIAFIDFSEDKESFDNFVEDFLEDLASISDKYRYKDAIGRPRFWRDELVIKFDGNDLDAFEDWNIKSSVEDPAKQRIAELLVSLLTGSINYLRAYWKKSSEKSFCSMPIRLDLSTKSVNNPSSAFRDYLEPARRSCYSISYAIFT